MVGLGVATGASVGAAALLSAVDAPGDGLLPAPPSAGRQAATLAIKVRQTAAIANRRYISTP